MKAFLTLVVLAMGLSAEAQIRLGTPAYGGTGCPAGTASVSVTDDQSILSVLFDSFVAEAPTPQNSNFDRKSCNLRIPISVGPGLQIALVAFDYRGFAAIPYGGRGSFEARYAYVGQRRPAIFRKNFATGSADNYSLKNDLISTTWDWTPCSTGKDLMMTVDANILAVTNQQKEAANVSVDSVDVSAGLLYSIQLRRCQ